MIQSSQEIDIKLIKELLFQFEQTLVEQFKKIICQEIITPDIISQFQIFLSNQLNKLELDCLCCQYLLIQSKSEKFNIELNQLSILIQKSQKLRKMNENLDKQNQEILNQDLLQNLQNLLISCKFKSYVYIFGIQNLQDFEQFSKYYPLIDKIITQKLKISFSQDQIQQQLLQLSIQDKEKQNGPFDEQQFELFVIKTIINYYNENLFNHQLVLQIDKLIRKNIFKFELSQINIIIQFIQTLQPKAKFLDQNCQSKQVQKNDTLYRLQLINYLNNAINYQGNKQQTIQAQKLISLNKYEQGTQIFYRRFKQMFIWQEYYEITFKHKKDALCLIQYCQHILQFSDKNISLYYFYISKAYYAIDLYADSNKFIDLAINSCDNIKYLFHQVRIQLKEKNYEKVISQANQCLIVNPNNSDAYNILGLILFRKEKNYENALENFNKAINCDHQNILFQLNKASTLYHLQQYDQCLEVCQNILKINSAIPRVYNIQSGVLLKQQKHQESDKQMEFYSVLQKQIQDFYTKDLAIYTTNKYIDKPLNYIRMFKQGISYFQFFNYKLALFEFKKSLIFNPIHKQLFTGKNIWEIAHYQTQSEQNSRDYQINQIQLIKLIDYENLEESLLSMISYTISFLHISQLLIIEQNYQKIKVFNSIFTEYCQMLIEIAKITSIEKQYHLPLQMLSVYYMDGKYSEAIKIFSKLAFKKKNHYHILSRSFQETGNQFDECVFKQFKNNQINPFYNQGYQFYLNEQLNEAEAFFEQQMASIDAYLMLGKVYYKLQKYQQSILQFNKALKIDQTNHWAHILKAQSYQKLGMEDKVAQQYEAALYFCLDQLEILISQSFYYYETNQFQQALVVFNHMFTKYPEEKIQYLFFKYGMTLYKLNDKQNALNKFMEFSKVIDYFYHFINQGLLYEQQDVIIAWQFYEDILPILKNQEEHYCKERIKYLQQQFE